jgi:hypothetical protein
MVDQKQMYYDPKKKEMDYLLARSSFSKEQADALRIALEYGYAVGCWQTGYKAMHEADWAAPFENDYNKMLEKIKQKII